jgi:DNA polymerase III sliding clamp (beta) subunit (PCNA family)
MEVIRKDLLAILDVLKPAVAKKEIICQQQHVIFMGSYAGTINGQIIITHPFETNFKTSVKFNDLQKILASSGDEKINIIVEEARMKILASDTKASLNTVVDPKDKIEEMLDSLMKSDMKDWKKTPEDLADALYLCAFSASRNQNDLVLTTVSINGDKAASSDKVRTSIYKMKGSIAPFLISAPDAQELSQFTITEYCISENWLHFKTDNGATFSARKYNGDHLPFEKLFSGLYGDRQMFNLPVSLKEAVSVVSALIDNTTDSNQFITLEFKTDGTIICKTERERGSIEKIVKSEYKGKEIMININPSFLQQILEKSTDMSLHQLKRGEGMIVDVAQFISGEFRHIILLPLVKR